ncbi:hypothetical protein DSO57_1020044 [Entomophthora muscae]|uniref:Uncharacterized protein n=1 Tax=Entomophthora muscae TaxID=34485 RepID=A0ACC2S5U3_9FUNG|nr:hypothetical protein DSO57_1020044 [Entomophthora muscae]
MEFTEGKIKKERFYLEAQTLVAMGAATFVDVKGALLNYVRPNCNLSITLNSGIYGDQTVLELMCHLGSFKEQFEIPFPDYKKSTSFPSSKSKGKSWEKDPLKKPKTISTTSINNTINNCTCYKCGQLGHLSWDCKQPKANVCHLGHKESKDDEYTEEKEEGEKDSEKSKKAEQTGQGENPDF